MARFSRNLLKAIFLLVVVLLAPVNSFAHETTSWASKDESACNLLSMDRSAEEPESQPVDSSGTPVDDCCDGAECCPDAGETPVLSAVRANFAGRPFIHPNSDRQIPEVYLAIFVPPEK
jgi:hypothetical protein